MTLNAQQLFASWDILNHQEVPLGKGVFFQKSISLPTLPESSVSSIACFHYSKSTKSKGATSLRNLKHS